MSDVEKVLVDVEPDPCKEDGEGFEAWWEDRSLLEKVLLGILFAIGGIALLALCGLAVMLLWNWLMPYIFGLPTLDYWQAWGLLILCSILFKGIGSSSGSSGSTERKRKKQLRRYMREGQDSVSSPKE
jgi:magnesium-transporting ATPase (P-type)